MCARTESGRMNSKVPRRRPRRASKLVGRSSLFGMLVAVLVFTWLQTGASAQSRQAQGETIFAANCSQCHGTRGQGVLEGASLHALPAGAKTIPGVADIVRSGLPDAGMRSFAGVLSEADIQAVAEYVVSEFGTAGQLGQGGQLFRGNCAACHGVTLGGGALIYSDKNAPNLYTVSAAEVVAAARSGPGTMPVFNDRTLPDDQLASIAAYVQSAQSESQPGGIGLKYPGPVTEGFVAVVVGLGAAFLAALWVERGGRG